MPPTTKREIVFIDRNVGDLQTLLIRMRPDVEAIPLPDDELASSTLVIRAIAKCQEIRSRNHLARLPQAAAAHRR